MCQDASERTALPDLAFEPRWARKLHARRQLKQRGGWDVIAMAVSSAGTFVFSLLSGNRRTATGHNHRVALGISARASFVHACNVETSAGSRLGSHRMVFLRMELPLLCRDDIVKWVQKKSGPPAVTLKESADLSKAKTDADVFLVGYFDKLEVSFEGREGMRHLLAWQGLTSLLIDCSKMTEAVCA